jgi:hypothetical protein
MLNTVVVMFKCATRVERRVYVYALDRAGELLFEGFKGEKVVAKDEAVIEQIVFGDAMFSSGSTGLDRNLAALSEALLGPRYAASR